MITLNGRPLEEHVSRLSRPRGDQQPRPKHATVRRALYQIEDLEARVRELGVKDWTPTTLLRVSTLPDACPSNFRKMLYALEGLGVLERRTMRMRDTTRVGIYWRLKE